MTFNFAGGMAAGAGYQAGADAQVDREARAEDRQYTRTQRTYQAGQQARTVAEQQREDDLRTRNAAIPSTEDVPTDLNAGTNKPALDDEGTPSAAALPVVTTTKQAIPLGRQLRMQAKNLAEVKGDHVGAMQLIDQADKYDAEQAQVSLAKLAGTSAGMSAVDLANAAARHFNSDPTPYRLSNIADDGKGGVTMDVTNLVDKSVTKKSFANADDLRQTISRYQAPQAMAARDLALQQMQAKASIDAKAKQEEEWAKPVTTAPGAVTTFSPNDPRAKGAPNGQISNENKLMWTGKYNPDGSPEMVMPGRGGKGAGTGGAVPDAIKDSLLKDHPELIAPAVELASALKSANPGIPEETANGVATRAVTGANRTRTFNPNTGMFETHFTDVPTKDAKGNETGHATGQKYLLRADTYADDSGIPPDEAAKAAASIAASSNKPDLDLFLSTKTPGGYQSYLTQAQAAQKQIEAKAVAEATAAKGDATKLAAVGAAYQAALAQVAASTRKMELMRKFYTPPAAPAAPGAKTGSVWDNAGLDMAAIMTAPGANDPTAEAMMPTATPSAPRKPLQFGGGLVGGWR